MVFWDLCEREREMLRGFQDIVLSLQSAICSSFAFCRLLLSRRLLFWKPFFYLSIPFLSPHQLLTEDWLCLFTLSPLSSVTFFNQISAFHTQLQPGKRKRTDFTFFSIRIFLPLSPPFLVFFQRARERERKVRFFFFWGTFNFRCFLSH